MPGEGGGHNRTGCRWHRVKHSGLVPRVERWLRDAGRKLGEGLATQPDTGEFEAGSDRSARDRCRLITAD